jgi:hypothetical protein
MGRGLLRIGEMKQAWNGNGSSVRGEMVVGVGGEEERMR